jgi:hypothetical protein
MISDAVTTVTPEQITAASAIHDHHMPGWARADRTLAGLSDSVPGLSRTAITVKATAVDRLCSIHHPRLGDAIERLVEVMESPPEDPIAIVEAIAPITVSGQEHWHWGFASTFTHWFIDGELPIHDHWAVDAATFHFGRAGWTPTAYRDFAEHVYALREASGLTCTIREMDRYLGLSGMYREWLGADDRSRLGMSSEVQGLFGNAKPRVQRALRTLVGTA